MMVRDSALASKRLRTLGLLGLVALSMTRATTHSSAPAQATTLKYRSSSRGQLAVSRALTNSFREATLELKHLAFNSTAAPPGVDWLQRLDSMLETYVREHGHHESSDAACRAAGGCVVAEYSCPERLGNRMHEFLNAMILAVVTNRTLLWSYVGGAAALNQSECPRLLTRAPWIPSVAMPITAAPVACRLDQVLPGGERSNKNVQQRIACYGVQVHSCAQGARLATRSFGHVASYAAQELAVVRFAPRRGRAVISAAIRGHMVNGNGGAGEGRAVDVAKRAHARASTLFGLGAHVAYGRLFDLAYLFDAASVMQATQVDMQQASVEAPSLAPSAPPIVGSSRGSLSSSVSIRSRGTAPPADAPPLYVGVHMRHRLEIMVGVELTQLFADALEAVLLRSRQSPPGRGCVVLFASDRRASLEPFRRAIRRTGCRLVASARGAEQYYRPEPGIVMAAEGADTGIIAVRDLNLLSRAHVLIGSFGSTFSLLVAELMASRRAADEERTPTVVWCDTDASVFGKSTACMGELPLVATERHAQWHLSLAEWPRARLLTPNSTLLPC